MSGVNKLQLVDGGKLSAVLELIKKDMEMKKMLNTLENPNNLTIQEKKIKWKPKMIGKVKI